MHKSANTLKFFMYSILGIGVELVTSADIMGSKYKTNFTDVNTWRKTVLPIPLPHHLIQPALLVGLYSSSAHSTAIKFNTTCGTPKYISDYH